ncbi:hypothetical protein PQR62_17505 [Herbaspirillum lusitanum]|jgi:septal ring factor EnvC (AmiA/AmiB activator)|uniref:DUF4404 domain-containing protein n=1 Tax=Herbaspirillum lusitanum TaxID=213312 RepID=A0ABW9AB06_9BURK
MSDNTSDTQHFNHQRLLQILASFEEELKKLPADAPEARQLHQDIARLKEHLTAAQPHPGSLRDSFQSLRNAADTVEGAILRDSPYLTEMGRIVGLL